MSICNYKHNALVKAFTKKSQIKTMCSLLHHTINVNAESLLGHGSVDVVVTVQVVCLLLVGREGWLLVEADGVRKVAGGWCHEGSVG